MTEQEWITTSDTWRMLHVVRGFRVSDRKVRLFNVAICKLFWEKLPEVSKAVLLESERLADGLIFVTPDELCERANGAVPRYDANPQASILREAAKAVCYAVLPQELFVAVECAQEIDRNDRRPESIIRDVFSNPFRPVAFDPAWRTPTVTAVAQTIYDERRFTDMPILGDALEEAGCNSQEMLDHCRNPGEHVRGCWVVDLILGKS